MTRIISYNIQYCLGIKGKKREYLPFWRLLRKRKGVEEHIKTFLAKHNPDLVALVEIDLGSFRSGFMNNALSFATHLGFKHIFSSVRYQKKLIGRLLHITPILKRQGTALLSRYPLMGKMHWLNRGVKRLVLEATVRCPKEVTLFVVHLALTKRARMAQMQQLADIISRKKGPVLVVGDFNTLKSLDEVQPLLGIGLHLQPTTPSFPTYNPKKTLDYALASSEVVINRHVVLPFDGSDHLPVLVDFEIKKQKK